MKKIFDRRDFLTTLSKAGMLPIIAPTVLLSREKQLPIALKSVDDFAFLTPPYLQAPTSHSMTIMWIVNQQSFSWVEYGLASDKLDQKAITVHAGLIEANNTVQKISLKSLQPSTKYYYRVCSKKIVDFQPYKLQWGEEIKSDIFSFETWPTYAENVSWLVFNDIHDRPESFPLLYKLAKQPKNDFVFLNGDMFNYDTDQQQLIDHLIQPLAALFASKSPFLYNRGNHETRGKFARQHALYFDNPVKENYFSFDLGPVHFTLLDTGEDKPDTSIEYSGLVSFDGYRQEQARWLEKEIQTPEFQKAPFRVVIMHIPTYESGDWHGTMHCRELFDPLFNKGKIDLLIAAHTHRYGIYQADPSTHHYPLVIGGGPKDGKRTVIKVNADRQKLTLNIIRDDGEMVGDVHITSKRT